MAGKGFALINAMSRAKRSGADMNRMMGGGQTHQQMMDNFRAADARGLITAKARGDGFMGKLAKIGGSALLGGALAGAAAPMVAGAGKAVGSKLSPLLSNPNLTPEELYGDVMQAGANPSRFRSVAS